ncbi:helix-turn-helix domain-containing protein [Frateuria sp.]|uniref:helix-turn-helix domain-containing protein n=1 Tax=Frateuria sp. TaxID=2211372 RepID=UPI002E13CF2A
MVGRYIEEQLSSRPARVPTKVAAEYLGVSPRTLEDWRAKKMGPNYVRVGHKVRYEPSELEAFISKVSISSR